MRAYSVGQINRYIKGMFLQDALLNAVAVKGEVSNCKYHSSNHIYFSIKDETGTLSCIMFAGDRSGLKFPMRDGDQVVVSGRIDIYERDGRYQLYAKEIRREGAGELYERFLALRRELEESGMFSRDYKLPIPRYVQTVGVVTAPTGAAIRDIENISKRRNPYVQLILYPALVQGKGAAASIARGIRMLDAYGVDVIIAGRGGGSYEDLWAFNEREVAEAIFSCQTPVISAVGHETDVTIADYVADLRAPTPSAAAELAVFDVRSFYEECAGKKREILQAWNNKLSRARNHLRWYEATFSGKNPAVRLVDQRRRLADLEIAFSRAMEGRLQAASDRNEESAERMRDALRETLMERKRKFMLMITRMKGLDPLDRLRQGYAYTENQEGMNIRSVRDTQKGDMLTIHVTDGLIHTRVECTEQAEREQ
ncbi:MAG: exodeoxyribonuclease VII large subunit [Lachnospiraceae bacterium]|nr:exodeoxyribonuclease VII large subunit [Lachnospiraceae bacterium]